MSPTQAEAALKRLAEAVSTLESRVERQAERRQTQASGDAELQRAHHDRSRLAQSLDAAEARAAKLEEVNREVAKRLISVMETVRNVLARQADS
ncbi:MAG: DUF4164 domain-containing protein [Bauldia sp.]